MSTNTETLERFVYAQEHDYDQALAELISGHKQTHWIWYILPQLRELGRSQMALKYGISSRTEAKEYAAHPVLGPRLLECVNAILQNSNRSAKQILGDVDSKKFKSCLTLFAEVAPSEPIFARALAAFYQGRRDTETLRLLGLESRDA